MTQQSSTAAPVGGVGLDLDRHAQDLLAGRGGAAAALAMRVVLAVARANGTRHLRPIASAHVDGCLYHGRAGLEFARRLVDLGGRVAVRTTLNVGSLDLGHPGTVRGDSEFRQAGHALMDAYVALGCEQTWTCAPYQISHRPAAGTHVAWAESNAIAFVNSVLGARTDRYGDFLDIAAAITGLVPDAGLHTDAARAPELVLDCSGVAGRLWASDAAWGALGAALGEIAGTRVAALTGLPGDLGDGGRTEDRLKAVAATAASAGGVALFHVVGVTPEAPDLAAVLRIGRADGDPVPAPGDAGGVPVVAVTTARLRAARDRLTTATGPDLDAVSIGTPHFSVSEFAALADLLADGPGFDPRVDVYVSTSRAVLAEADRLGHVDPLRAAGGRIVTDTCTYVTPILDPAVRTVMTNSGKWAWYAPGNLGIDVVLGNLADCVASARAGRVVRDEAGWADDDPVSEADAGSPEPGPAGAHPAGLRASDPRPPPPATPHPSGADGEKRRGAAPTSPSAEIRCTVLHPGSASGRLLMLNEPLSFWGGVSAAGVVIDRHHPQCGTSLTGRVVAMGTGRGSSSSSSVLAELIRSGGAPAAVLLTQPDTIIVLGAVVAAELYGTSMPVLQLDPASLAALPPGWRATVDGADGSESIGGSTTMRVTRR